jgi:hypothetical protein
MRFGKLGSSPPPILLCLFIPLVLVLPRHLITIALLDTLRLMRHYCPNTSRDIVVI